MGSNPIYIPISKAAKILECEPAKVHELCDQGLIRRKLEKDKASVRREDIIEVHRLQLVGELRPGELVKRLLFLEQKVSRLEHALNLLYEVNQLGSSRFLHMEDTELHQLYGDVVDALGESSYELDQMVELGEAFLRITEVEIDRLNEILQIDNSWLPFYRLCLKITKHIGLSKDLDVNLDLQRVRDLVHQGRKNLQTLAVLFIENKAQLGPSRELLAKMAAADVDSFDVLTKQLVGTKAGNENLQLS